MHAYHPMQDQVGHCFLLTTCLRWSSLSAATIGSSFFRWYEIRWLMLSNNMSLVRTCREDGKRGRMEVSVLTTYGTYTLL